MIAMQREYEDNYVETSRRERKVKDKRVAVCSFLGA